METEYPEYIAFIKSKVRLAESWGFDDFNEAEICPMLKPHQRAIVAWNVRGGRRADFASFGLGKSVISLETARIISQRVSGRALIVLPLGVKQEFIRDAERVLGWTVLPKFIRRIEEADATGVYLTNYETVRDGKIDPAAFDVVILDEASILRGFGGSKTFREMMRLCTGDGGPSGNHRTDGKRVKYRFVATATPAPNDYIELLAYSEFLGVMDISQAKTRFFKRDSTKADNLTLHPHKEREFWLWVASWALFVERPSDLGFSDEGYSLPPMEVHWHEVETDHSEAGHDRSGQSRMFRDAAIGVQDAAAEKRISLPARIERLMSIRDIDPGAHRVIWHDLEAERHALEKAIPGIVTVCGSDTDDHKVNSILGFSDGLIPELAGKPSMLGSGCNLQKHCAWAIYLGVGFKFNEFCQSIHRIQRFLQTRPVRIDIIYTEAEREIRRTLEAKWTQHKQMVENMTKIIREFGLSRAAMAHTLTRKLGIERVEVTGPGYRLVNYDCVLETRRMEANTVDLILTSIPFSSQYEYSPNYADFGHSEGNAEFFQQMEFLSPELLRVLQPGRIAAIHVKDRIVPGGMTGLGCQTVYPFHSECIRHYTRHGFAYMGMISVITDVVRENNQTYRLGHTEQCKDGTKMGVGMPEYILLFRKPTTDRTRSYADKPVTKSKKAYDLAKWQVDAHAFWRSSGERLLKPEELRDLPHATIFQIFKRFSLERVYDFEHHIKLNEELLGSSRLPTDFMLLQPQSWSPEVWTDVTRMLTLNTSQSQKGAQMHLCPMQFDIADRIIERFSMKGETVYDPFGGLMTVPFRAVKAGRVGAGAELSVPYFADGCAYVKAAAEELAMPTLFALDEIERTAPVATEATNEDAA